MLASLLVGVVSVSEARFYGPDSDKKLHIATNATRSKSKKVLLRELSLSCMIWIRWLGTKDKETIGRHLDELNRHLVQVGDTKPKREYRQIAEETWKKVSSW